MTWDGYAMTVVMVGCLVLALVQEIRRCRKPCEPPSACASGGPCLTHDTDDDENDS